MVRVRSPASRSQRSGLRARPGPVPHRARGGTSPRASVVEDPGRTPPRAPGHDVGQGRLVGSIASNRYLQAQRTPISPVALIDAGSRSTAFRNYRDRRHGSTPACCHCQARKRTSDRSDSPHAGKSPLTSQKCSPSQDRSTFWPAAPTPRLPCPVVSALTTGKIERKIATRWGNDRLGTLDGRGGREAQLSVAPRRSLGAGRRIAPWPSPTPRSTPGCAPLGCEGLTVQKVGRCRSGPQH